MRCVGWRKSYEQFQLFGRYTWAERIQANLFEYNRLMNFSRGPSNILGTMFRNMANFSFQDNQDLLRRHHIPAMGALHFNEETQVNDCAPHITFTSNGYFNKPHRDDQDISQFAFLLVAPCWKENRNPLWNSRSLWNYWWSFYFSWSWVWNWLCWTKWHCQDGLGSQ